MRREIRLYLPFEAWPAPDRQASLIVGICIADGLQPVIALVQIILEAGCAVLNDLLGYQDTDFVVRQKPRQIERDEMTPAAYIAHPSTQECGN